MYLQGLIDKAGNGGLMISKDGRQGDITFEIADLDDHLVAFFGHRHLVHLDVRQREAQDVGIALASNLLYSALKEDLCGIAVAEDGLSQIAQWNNTQDLARIVGGFPDG